MKLMKLKHTKSFDPQAFLATIGPGKTHLTSPKGHVFFSQGDAADAVFYVQGGKIKLTVLSRKGKEAVVAILGRKSFFGESCLTGNALRLVTTTSLTESVVVRIEKAAMIHTLHAHPAFSELFTAYLLTRNVRIQEDLVDQLFNSSEKRLARALLLLAHFGKDGKPEEVIPKISQETLADMIGTTRSRVSFFLNKFKRLGFIHTDGGMHVHSSLLNVVLHD